MNDAVKFCSSCGIVKPFDEFNRQKVGVLGRQPKCRECEHIYKRANSNRIKENSLNYRVGNKEKLKAISIKWQKENKERVAIIKKRYNDSDHGKFKLREYNLKYRLEKPEFVSNIKRKWGEKNKHRSAGYAAARRAKLLKATPSWANSVLIEGYYLTAQGLSMHTGEWHHVDHIVPLKSKTVCGLHCESNLKVIAAIDNLKKGNYFWPDMP